MYKTRMGEAVDHGVKLQLGYVETDPSGRYGRFRDILGKGAMKTVYRAFDEVLGMEVAWNQVKLIDVFRSPEELQRLYSEVHLLKNLSHDSIMRFHVYWVDVDRRTFNFITEMFTSGTLREYRQRYKRVSMRAIKNWARQILEGLAYLHSHDPPVIHRDLKCDNIFVNGHLGQVKIGDLGLAAILGGSHHAHSVIGTPEFMAPELYEEEYDELVDVYSFGMCVLEMLTSEYPYSECSNPAQIYKKVTSGKLPEAFYRIQDFEAQRFIGKCLETASKRPSAHELLLDPFLASEEDVPLMPIHKIPSQKLFPESRVLEMPPSFADPERSTDMTITGSMNAEDDTIFLKVQITDKQGQARNIFFPFDIASDTAMDVALEMVKELDITDWKPHEIAEMIDEEIKFLVPNWKTLDDSPRSLQQHSSFNYEDDDDNDDNTHHPFYSFSNHSSSEASLTGFLASCESQCYGRNIAMTTGYEWLQEDIKSFDDASSESSLNSYKYSNLNYCSAYDEQDYETSSKTKDPHYMARTSKCSRFSPQVSIADKRNKDNSALYKSGSACGLNQHHKMTRTRSLMDIRSQLLHRTIVEEINRRRMFKTVAAVENIGYHEPGDFPREGSSSDRFKRIF